MTRKDFEVIASAIAEEVATLRSEMINGLDRSMHLVGAELTARRLAGKLSVINPRFDHARFMAACGFIAE